MSQDEDYRHPSAEEGIELYESLGGRLQRTLMNRFAVPPPDAERLVFEVFFSYVTRRATVDDPKRWLTAKTWESGVTWQRRHAETPQPEIAAAELQEWRERLLVPGALEALPAPVREMVRLRFAEERTYEEIAAEMGVSMFYVKTAVNKARERLQKMGRLERK
jgi:RNA polymerase sigma factor (sigma-70 family)